MPHAESDMTETQVNGTKPSSLFLQHLSSYPVVSDGISMFYENPYGKKSLSVADTGYSKFVKPITPYFQKPYSYLAPYVAKADELADSGLTKVDERFPMVTETTENVKGKVSSLAGTPMKLAGDGKEYVYKVYGDEYEKRGGQKGGITTPIKASATTALVMTLDFLSAVSSYLGGKKEEAKDATQEKLNH